MHIEKNVFDNIIGTVLGLEGKTKDDLKARKGLKVLGVRRHLWPDKDTGEIGRASFTVHPEDREVILEYMKDARYPFGFAGSIRSKVIVEDKKFVGLKTHDCHVILQRLLPVFIRPYLPCSVVDPLVGLSNWFRRLCSRELTKDDVEKLKEDIVTILCKFEKIFPPSFFTIMVHLMVHLPDQILLKGPVHYNWMYPMERQLGHYKKYVRNKRFPEGCIAEEYTSNDCVTFCKLYMGEIQDEGKTKLEENDIMYDISVVSHVVKPLGFIRRMQFDDRDVDIMHWCVIENCSEANEFVARHEVLFNASHPMSTNDDRIEDFHTYLLDQMIALQDCGSHAYSAELHMLAYKPQFHNCYTHCYVNGVKYVIWERDRHLKTQNCGVMVEAGETKYYGVLQSIIELKYAEGMPVVLFKCEWYNSDPREENLRHDRGLLSIDTSNTWFNDAPYCLAKCAQQVFYLDDPRFGSGWKVVTEVHQRGIYSDYCLAYDKDISGVVFEAYQEESTIPPYVPTSDHEDVDESDEDDDQFHSIPGLYNDYCHPELDRSSDEDEYEYVSDDDDGEEDDEDGGAYITDDELDENGSFDIEDEDDNED